MTLLDLAAEENARSLSASIDDFFYSTLTEFVSKTSVMNRVRIAFRAKKHVHLQQQFLSSNLLLLTLWFEARGKKILLGSKELHY